MVILEGHLQTTIPIEVDGIVPERLQEMNESNIRAIPVWLGREQVELGEIFRVRVTGDDARSIRWIGHLSNVHRIGSALKSGRIEIEGHPGRHVGSLMEGGSIHVHGSVGDFAGAEMRGGLIRIEGNAGDHLGGCYPGSKWGLNRGEIVVCGSAGLGVGERMRRGLIAVAGNVGRLCGWNLWAGSIVVGGNCGAECGLEMVRGTIVQMGKDNVPLAPTFSKGSVYGQAALRIMGARLRELEFMGFTELLTRDFVMFHGDHLRGGRGEILVARQAGQGST